MSETKKKDEPKFRIGDRVRFLKDNSRTNNASLFYGDDFEGELVACRFTVLRSHIETVSYYEYSMIPNTHTTQEENLLIASRLPWIAEYMLEKI